MADAALTGVDGSDAQEEEISAGHEGVGRRVCGFLAIHFHVGAGQGIAPQHTNQGRLNPVKVYTGLPGNLLSQPYLEHVLLAIIKREGKDFLEMPFGPKQAGGGVLSSTEHYQCTFCYLHFVSFFCKTISISDPPTTSRKATPSYFHQAKLYEPRRS